MKQATTYSLIAGGLLTGLVGGITLGVSEAEDLRQIPTEVARTFDQRDSDQPVMPISDVIAQYEKDGQRITDIEFEREMLRDVYELELVDANGTGWDLDVDARTGEVLSRHKDHDWMD